MKISYNWLKEFIDTEKSPEEISKILTGTGLEVESLEKVQAIAGGLEGLVIGYVKETTQHPNADRLKVTKVDVGGAEDLQIVCGASNVAAGQKVVVATVGTMVHPSTGEPFKINKSKIRGEVSEGMICAEDEIGLGHSHEGIMVLDADVPVGKLAKEHFNVQDDYMYEIGLTPNRADAASHLGTARDIAAFLKIAVKKPDVSAFKIDNNNLNIEVVVENEQASPRYSGVTISGLEVKESPDWLKERLAVIGVRAINNVVDVTNYVLHELGQPLHAFDAAAIAGSKVIVKNVAEGTVFKTLDDVDRKLSADDLMICNAEEPMCIAGVFGGAKSGVTETTKAIFLESAYFNSVSVRKTAKRHGLKTDASFRFERGTDPDMTVFALKRAALLIQQVAGGQVSSEIFDHYPAPVAPFDVEVTFKNIDRLIGKAIGNDTIKSILTSLDIAIVNETAEGLSLKVPPYRVDVTREVDVIEEILRLYGYNNIEIPTQIRASLNTSQRPEKDTVQNAISDLLSANGFNEILSNSLTKSAYSDNLETAVKILNPLSGDLDVMRQSMLYSGLEAIAYNANRQSGSMKFYEFGKIYNSIGKDFVEEQRLSLFLTGRIAKENWQDRPNFFIPLVDAYDEVINDLISNDYQNTVVEYAKLAKKKGKAIKFDIANEIRSIKAVKFTHIKSIVDAILTRLKIFDYKSEVIASRELLEGIQYKRGNNILVTFGSVNYSVLEKMSLDYEVFYADFDFDALLKIVRRNAIVYQEISKFPAVRRDLSMLIDDIVTFDQLKQIAEKTERKLLKEVNIFDIYRGSHLPAGKKSYALSFILQDTEKTLTDKAIDTIMQKIIYNLGKEAGAEIRK